MGHGGWPQRYQGLGAVLVISFGGKKMIFEIEWWNADLTVVVHQAISSV